MARAKQPKWATVERLDVHPGVDAYIEGLGGARAELVQGLRELVREAVPEAKEAIYWGVPFFFIGGPICYLSAARKHVTFGLTRGDEIAGDSGLLEGTGATSIRKATIKLHSPVPEAAIRDWLVQSVMFDADDDTCREALEAANAAAAAREAEAAVLDPPV